MGRGEVPISPRQSLVFKTLIINIPFVHDVEWYDKHLTKINLNKIFLWMMFFLKKKEYSDLFWKLKKKKKRKRLGL